VSAQALAREARQAAIALGSNVGAREEHLAHALRRLSQGPDARLLRASSFVETEPVGGPPGQGRYLNGACLVETTLEPRALLELLQAIERECGRDRAHETRNGPRTLDLDLILLGDLVVADEDLQVPHPRWRERAFVLAPLAEIAPGLRDPRDGAGVAELHAHLELMARRGGLGMASCASVAEARAWCQGRRAEGATIGFVPTMGALHAGHLALVRRAAREADFVVASIFVNPLQFNDKRDYELYPRDFAADARLLAPAGCSMAFTGTLEQFFPGELDALGRLSPERKPDPGPGALGLEGDLRPGHFAGVAAIVDRLFDVVRPTAAYFGAKDYQQTRVVLDLARRRGEPRIVVCPTVREVGGLAMSSRNERLSSTDRTKAAIVHRALQAGRAAWRAGERDAGRLRAEVARELAREPDLRVEYVALRDPQAWRATEPEGSLEARAICLVAAWLAGVRLIDNLRFDDPSLEDGEDA